MRWLSRILFIMLVFAADGAYVITNTGRQITGSKITAGDDGAVTLMTDSGQTMTFRKGQYRTAAADRPVELDIAEDLFKKEEPEKAALLLKKVKRDYRNLGWDQKAVRMLADHLFSAGEYGAAVQEYQLLEEQDASVLKRIREAMMQSGDRESVLKTLNRDIEQGSRAEAAEAYFLRGDLKAEDGDSEGARRDWLKIRLYFKDQKEMVLKAEERLKSLE